MLYRITCLLCTLLLMPLLTAHGATDIPAFPVTLSFRTHGITLTETELRKMLNIAQHKLEPEIHIVLTPDNSSFDANHNVKKLDNIVIDPSDVHGCDIFTKLLKNDPGVVHIVDDIPCCGSDFEGDGKPQIGGCSGLHLAILVLRPQQQDLQIRAVQLMHELGHNKGLCHNTCNLLTNPLMSSKTLGGTDTQLDPCEKKIFTGGDLSDPACTLDQCCRPINCGATGAQATFER
jgi:hypothetical protein